MIDQTALEQRLKEYIDPYLEIDLVTAKAVTGLDVDGDVAKVTIQLGFPVHQYAAELQAQLTEHLQVVPGVNRVEVVVTSNIIAHSAQKGVNRLNNVKNIIAIASGKGGVGKSTTTANLALALQAEGATVGVLDADIYGPSQTLMLGMQGQPESPDGRRIQPMRPHGLQAISMGLMVDQETPMIWRGPMVTQALQQLLNETLWDDVDYLIIDLPPGTGDIQLTLAQKIPVSGAIIVTTPQDIALLDARRALKMFEKVAVPVLGVVENMSTHICSQCGHEEAIFGSDGGQRMADEYNIEMLGSLPLDINIRQQADSGMPTVVAQPDSKITESYQQIARKTAAKLSLQSKDYSSAFPKIVIKND